MAFSYPYLPLLLSLKATYVDIKWNHIISSVQASAHEKIYARQYS
jgi:hypothetical protein